MINNEQYKTAIKSLIGDSWYKRIGRIFSNKKVLELSKRIKEERIKYSIYPESKETFKCLQLCSYEDVKVVILGNSPYWDGNADGLAFSCKNFVSDSLYAILKSIGKHKDLDIKKPYTLDHWAKQGVLLLNCTLTTTAAKYSHTKYGWNNVIEPIIRELNQKEHLIWLLWNGKDSQYYKNLINTRHTIFIPECSPNAAYYNKDIDFDGGLLYTNIILTANNENPINW